MHIVMQKLFKDLPFSKNQEGGRKTAQDEGKQKDVKQNFMPHTRKMLE